MKPLRKVRLVRDKDFIDVVQFFDAHLDPDKRLQYWEDRCCNRCLGEGIMGGCIRCLGTGVDPIRHPLQVGRLFVHSVLPELPAFLAGRLADLIGDCFIDLLAFVLSLSEQFKRSSAG